MAQVEHATGKKKKFSKKIVVIGGIALLVLLIGGGAAFFFLKGTPVPAAVEKSASHEEEEAGEKLYYDMSNPFIVNFPKDSSAKLMRISVAFLVEGQETIDALKKHEPMVRNNLLMLMSAQQADELKNREGKEKLRSAMLREVTEVLMKMAGKSHIKEVFFTSFVMQ
ncbi:Flagellar protein FliL [Candidatus Methylobacter favarea]|uniref:Flagellar protein FliL n=1 Tax=Candidatus Methylobacter favarea TaxID=2707345 RepID=A0A8S0Y6C2_9GAMM|nr:flagellar basal body-associated FliL family protein [Candidatus Methylobacter favarea]CAA9890993.1 Flagellar protein FliL [Candidatus Methylobacter favarea]